MALEIIESYTLEGPSIYFPQPGVVATIHADTDVRSALSHAIKSWAQAVGLIIGYLRFDITPAPSGAGYRIWFQFTCNHPLIGLTIVQHALDDLRAAERNDPDWSHDDQLFEVRRWRMRQDPALPLLQLRAEAQGRGIPVLPVGDGTLQLGTGAASWRFDPAQLSVGMQVEPPWEQISVIPLVVVSGTRAAALAAQLNHVLQGPGLQYIEHGDWDTIRAGLLDQHSSAMVVVLEPQSALERGLPFNRCLVALIDPFAPATHELALAAGLPALVADEAGAVIAQANDPRGVDLTERSVAQALLLAPDHPPPRSVDPLINTIATATYEFWFK